MIWTFVSPGDLQGDQFLLTGRKAIHLARVRRIHPGEAGVAVCDRMAYDFVVSRVTPREVEARVTGRRMLPSGRQILLLPALLPNQDFAALLEAATEVGVHRIRPIAAARSVARPETSRIARWRAVLESAAEQSQRERIPDVDEPAALEAALADSDWDQLVVLDPGSSVRLAEVEFAARIAVAVGPEGGWTEDELRQFDGAGGRRVTLGPYILRARLAAPVAIAILVQQR